MPITLDLFPYLDPLFKIHQHNNQQPDNLCGPYWISLLLAAYGQITVSAVDVAIAASTILPSHGDPSCWLPPNTSSLQGIGYEQIPTSPDLSLCGTAITGLLQATHTLSQGKFCLIPLQTANWQDGLSTLSKLCHAYPSWQAIPLLNPHTSYLWGTTPSPFTLLSHLQSQHPPTPPTDWNVGHFNLLIGTLQQNAHPLYTLLATSPQFGWQGMHVQPPSVLSQALHRRQHETEGGLALFISAEFCADIERVITENGFSISAWDNGSPVDMLEKATPESLLGGESL